MRLFLLLLMPLALVAVGCGSNKSSERTIEVLPNATTSDEWATRIVDRLMRPLNRDLETLGTLNNPQTRAYIEQGNPDTLAVLDRRITDLGKCSDRLTTIGPPPQRVPDKRKLNRVDAALHRTCDHYGEVAETLRDAVKLLSSGRTDVVERGQKKLRDVAQEAGVAAGAYDEAVRIAQTSAAFRRSGLKPPA